ncbi:MAG: glycosyltransferase family 39 protein [Acidobacteria bacterium]|nr:glycosyltransferase family 39 protein [Acidobacteriota bacterium]
MRSLFYPILVCLLAYVLFFSGLSTVGLVGPDEPRYAGVAREMFRSGDYITPRLYGEPWFEKPPLYYWLAALVFSLGSAEGAARLPSALCAALFLGFWFQFAQRYFGRQSAILSCILLGSTLGWIGFARAAAMDMLLAATLGAALLLLARWFWEQKAIFLWGFYLFLGVATLAKGLLPLALAGMIVLAYIVHFRQWQAISKLLWTPSITVFFAIALPWYVLCYLQNGYPFFEEFILKHHWQRLVSPAIGHPQPFWFYVPILLTGLFPWSAFLLLPILALARQGLRPIFRDARSAYLFYWVAAPFVFFSIAQNKLPNYLLPILPPLSLWIAHLVVSNQEGATTMPSEPSRSVSAKSAFVSPNPPPDSLLTKASLWCVGFSALLLLSVPLLVALLPGSLASGLRRAMAEWDAATLWSQVWGGAVPVAIWTTLLVLVGITFLFLWQGRIVEGILMVLFGVGLAVFSITTPLAPSIDRVASVRRVVQRLETLRIAPGELAVYRIRRDQTYQFNYYFDRELPAWSPEMASAGVFYVIAGQAENLPHARSLVLFPGPKLRLWELTGP